MLFLLGCHKPVPQSRYIPGGAAAVHTPETDCVRRNLGEYPAIAPSRPIRALLLEGNGKDISRLPEVAFGAGNLPNDVDTVVLLMEGDVKASRSSSHIPNEDAIHTALGEVSLPTSLVKRICDELKCTGRRSLNHQEAQQVGDVCLAMKLKYGTVSVLPLILNGRGLGKLLAGALMKEMFDGRTILFALLPPGYMERKPEWRKNMASVVNDGWKGQSVPLTALATLELGRQLELTPFELTRKPFNGTTQVAERKREFDLLALLESRKTAGIMKYGRERSKDVAPEDVVKDVSSIRDLISGDYQEQFINDVEEKVLLSVARAALTRAVGGNPMETAELPQYTKRFLEPLGCTVSIIVDGKVYNSKYAFGTGLPLLRNMLVLCGKLVKDTDHPLDMDTLDKAVIEVGVFSKPFTLCFKTLEQLYAQLRKGRHGVVLTVDGKSS
ncbi:MAG: hypothetical protein J6X55_04260, partial [Victivallales bacterium]|nr:hypothetical protein [Victivallales bacterium]